MACPCQKCAARERNKVVTMPNGSKRRRCDDCGRGIPPYTGMQGSGFQAESVDHEYMEVVKDNNFFMPVHLELCYVCYMKDYAKNYPNSPLPQIANVRDFEDVAAPSLPAPVELDPGYFVFTA